MICNILTASYCVVQPKNQIAKAPYHQRPTSTMTVSYLYRVIDSEDQTCGLFTTAAEAVKARKLLASQLPVADDDRVTIDRFVANEIRSDPYIFDGVYPECILNGCKGTLCGDQKC